MSQNMKIANYKVFENRWTWISPNKTKHELDFIFTSNQKLVKDWKIIDVKFDSDHKLVMAKINFNIKRNYFIQKQTTKLWKLRALLKTTANSCAS